jgi:hypothetical protein
MIFGAENIIFHIKKRFRKAARQEPGGLLK